MISNKPTISAIIPVYNCEKYLSQAIDSILDQTYKNVEIIVVNDGSEDGTANIAERYSDRIKYFCQKNSGIGAARNKGIKNATGDFLSFLDADDLWVRDKLSVQFDVFLNDDSVDIVYGHVSQFFSPDVENEIRNKFKCPEESMPGKLSSTMLAKKSKFLSIGLFTNKKSVGVDVDWYLRARDANLNIVMLDDILLKRRIHKSNNGIIQKNKRPDYIRHLKESLDRRRKNNTR